MAESALKQESAAAKSLIKPLRMSKNIHSASASIKNQAMSCSFFIDWCSVST